MRSRVASEPALKSRNDGPIVAQRHSFCCQQCGPCLRPPDARQRSEKSDERTQQVCSPSWASRLRWPAFVVLSCAPIWPPARAAQVSAPRQFQVQINLCTLSRSSAKGGQPAEWAPKRIKFSASPALRAQPAARAGPGKRAPTDRREGPAGRPSRRAGDNNPEVKVTDCRSFIRVRTCPARARSPRPVPTRHGLQFNANPFRQVICQLLTA